MNYIKTDNVFEIFLSCCYLDFDSVCSKREGEGREKGGNNVGLINITVTHLSTETNISVVEAHLNQSLHCNLIRGAVNKFVEQGINKKQTLTSLVSLESSFFHICTF